MEKHSDSLQDKFLKNEMSKTIKEEEALLKILMMKRGRITGLTSDGLMHGQTDGEMVLSGRN